MKNKATWNDVVLVVRGLSPRKNRSPVQGNFKISSLEGLQALRACLNSEEDTHLLLLKDEDQAGLQIGDTVEVEVFPRFGFGLLASNVTALLDAQGARILEPKNFLLLEDHVSNTDTVNEDHLLTRYRLALSFIQTLKRCAAFLDPEQEILIFIKDGKFEVPIEYSGESLRRLQSDAIRNLTAVIPNGSHEEQCKSILAEAIVDMTKHLPAAQRFSYLLEHASDLKKRFEQGYNLFAAGFSYEKVRDQVESARIEFINKIHKVFADIQNQLLGIPVATIIVATQMKNATSFDYEFWINLSVLIGCWVFAILMVFLLVNQSHTLEVVTTEINRQRRQLEKDYSLVASNFSETFSFLIRRTTTQRNILRSVYAFIAIGLALSHVVFFKVTVPARDWLFDRLPWLSNYL